MTDSAITFAVLIGLVVVFIWNKLPVEVVAIGAALTLYVTGVLTAPQALAGFGDPAVILIAALFVVSEGLDSAGLTSWVGGKISAQSKSSKSKLVVLVMLASAAMTALIGLNGAVAALIPMAVIAAMRAAMPSSRMLMPMAFAGSAGGLLLLTGSPVNIIVSDAASDNGVGAFGLLEFLWVGVPAVAGVIVLVAVLGPRLLPDRQADQAPKDFANHAGLLLQEHGIEQVTHAVVPPGSIVVGNPRTGIKIDKYGSTQLVAVRDAERGKWVDGGFFDIGDRVTVLAKQEDAVRLINDYGLELEVHRDVDELRNAFLTEESGAAEIVIPPRSRFGGQSMRPGAVLDDSGLLVLSIRRPGSPEIHEDHKIRTGDVLLVEGPWSELNSLERDKDVLVVDSPDLVRRQAVAPGKRAIPALISLGLMVTLLITGLVPPAIAALFAAMVMVLGRVLTVNQAYRGISWSTVLMVAGMIPISTAITVSGAGESIADFIVRIVGEAGPTALLLVLGITAVILGQLISNTAVVLVMIPVALSAAQQLDISARPVLMSLAVVGAAAFLTPVATPANMMVMGPGGYKFGDYWKLGSILALYFLVLGVFYVPLIWSFT